MRKADLRLFVGIYPPPEAVERMLGELHARGVHCRASEPGQVHMTAQFIGSCPPPPSEGFAHVAESVERSVAGLEAFALRPVRLVTLPERGPVRLIACITDLPPALREIHRRLVQRLAMHPGAGKGDRRPFLPHFTLGRFDHTDRSERVDEPLELPTFLVEDVRLMHSTLTPQGAVHREMKRVVLGARRKDQ